MRKWLFVVVLVGANLGLGGLGLAQTSGAQPELPGWMQKRLKQKETPSLTPDPVPSTQPAPSSLLPEGVEVKPKEKPQEEQDEIHAFALSKLVTARSIKPTASTELIRVGVRVWVAPVRAVAKSQLDSIKKANPDIEEVVDLLGEVDLESVENAEELQAALLNIDGLTASERTAIQQEVVSSPEIETLLDVSKEQEEAITFAIEPHLTLNFDPAAVGIRVPLAGFAYDGESHFEMGNLTLETVMGHYEALPGATAGVSYGFSLSMPSGTSRADALALSNLLTSPLFRHAYMSVEPFFAVGMDAKYVIIQAEVGVTNMWRVRVDDTPDAITYLRYGAGFSLLPFEVIALSIELAGSAGIQEARAFDLLMFIGGLRFRAAGVEPGIAVQAPIALPGREDYGSAGGLALGSPADINVLGSLSFGF